ncbi:MAG: creatininase family protein [Candidatus Bipolaricaulota bacterium]|nr:MAG: creatininase family protein [Candidatus Bipolaricaulota bacterium]
MSMWITTEHPAILFEDTEVGRLKKRIWDASPEEIDAILEAYGVPSEPELGKAGSYIQTTVRQRLIENRRKNDVVLIPVGCTENHGRHTVSGLDTFMVTQICEAVRRKSLKDGPPVNLALPPLNYGGHPYHHIGMPGTVIMPEEVVRETLINVMLGLWNDGFRKQIVVNNHGQLWMLESALHEFMYRYQLPGVFQVLDWHRAVREFFFPTDKSDSLETHFIHADESETAVGLLMFPEGMTDMGLAEEAEGEPLLPGGHFDTAVDAHRRPHKWSEGEGQMGIEIASTPQGVVGKPTLATAEKAKRPIAAILSYLTMTIDQILATFPAGTVPPVEKVTLRTQEEMEPYLREPGAAGWKPALGLPRRGF